MAVLKGSGIFDIWLAGALVYIYLISVGNYQNGLSCTYLTSPYPYFPLMVVMYDLCALVHLVVLSDVYSGAVVAAADRLRCHHTHYQYQW